MTTGRFVLILVLGGAVALGIEPGATDAEWESAMRQAESFAKRGDWKPAAGIYHRAAETAPHDEGRVIALSNLGSIYVKMGKFIEAERALREAVRVDCETSVGASAGLATTLNNLGSMYIDSGRFGKAKPVLLEALEIYRSGGGDPLTHAAILNNLAELERIHGGLAGAEDHYRNAKKILELHNGSDRASLASVLLNIGVLALERGDAGESEKCIRRALDIWEATFPPHPYAAFCYRHLGRALAHQQQHEEAAKSYRRALDIAEASLGPDHPRVGDILLDYSATLRKMKQKKDAKELKKRAVAILTQHEEENLLHHTVDFSTMLRDARR